MQAHYNQGREVASWSNTYSLQSFSMEYGNNTYCKKDMSPTYSVMSGFRYGESSSDLPPTPPSNAQDFNQSLSSPSQSILDKVSATSGPLKLPIRTFGHHRNPPTPDNTPPRGLDVYGRSPSSSKQLNYASSRAESFITAREHPFSSQVDIGTSLSEHESTSRVDVVDHDEDVENTLTDSASEPEGEIYAAERQNKDKATLNEREHQSILFSRNLEDNSQPTHDTNTFTETGYSPHSQRETPIQEPWIGAPIYSTPYKATLTPDRSPHSAKTSETRLLNDDLGRISATSTLSSIVQAVVLDASPRQRHSLRHAGRNLAYRSSNDSTPDSPPSRKRSSNISHLHHLSPKNQEIPKEGLNIYDDLTTQQRTGLGVASDPQSKQNIPNPYSMRYIAPKITYSPPNTLPNIRQIPFASSTRSRVTSAPDGGLNNYKSESISSSRDPTMTITYGKQNNYQIPRKRVNSSFRSPAHSILTKDVKEELGIQRNLSNSSQENGYLARASSTGASSLRQKLQAGRSGDAVQEINIMQDVAVRSGSNGSTFNVLSPVRNSQASGSSSEKQQIEEATRSGLIRSSSGAYRLEPRRKSSERFSARLEEHAMARHLYPQGTPFSHITDSQDALEVSEATAVSIFPHNNNSLLVVQQMARSMPSPRREPTSSSSIPIKSSQLEVNLLPATPPEKALQSRPSSPLENPRKPPVPPAFQVIPPTPCEEADREYDMDPKVEDFPAPPPRRLSLIKRVRRYSDTFVQPILSQAIPTWRNANQPASGKAPIKNENQKNKLHPFWRPRGFWDEFESDSDPDNHEDEGEDERLPPGGDTSNIVDNDAKPKRRLTFRGTGGFLIGNTLGVTRAGTNIRRHHISLPARLAAAQQRQSRESARNSSDQGNKDSGASSLGFYSSSSAAGKSTASLSTLMLRNHGRIYKIPGLGVDFQYIGMSGIRTLMAVKRRKRERRKMEERRDRLRQSIVGPRVSV